MPKEIWIVNFRIELSTKDKRVRLIQLNRLNPYDCWTNYGYMGTINSSSNPASKTTDSDAEVLAREILYMSGRVDVLPAFDHPNNTITIVRRCFINNFDIQASPEND
jgi:hypothetical protein